MAHGIPPLRGGHQLQLLEGSREYFPALVEAIDAARTQVLLETYIFDVTGAGADVGYALERAARRGVSVQLTVDGVGTPSQEPWRWRLEQAGVQLRVYSPVGRFGLLERGQWRRLHRKLCVVDARVGFCGGVNILDDFHDPNHGTLQAPRMDFALRVTGPLVAQMHQTMTRAWLRMQMFSRLRRAQLSGALVSLRASRTHEPAAPQPRDETRSARAALVLRDNVRNRASIERAYRRAIGHAREEIVIANAYFVPGGKMRRAIVQAARRGVKVKLLLQGRYEYFMQYYAARPVFGALLKAGVEIHEYSPSFLHAKVAVIDGTWATVGSSNLDPLSLLLAREANVMVEDAGFAGRLRERLAYAMQHEGTQMDPVAYANRSRWQRAKEWLAFALMRLALAFQGKKGYL